MDVWTLKEIIEYLDANEGTVIIRGGLASVQFPDTSNRERHLKKILPHLRARRGDVLRYFADVTHEPHPLQKLRPELFADTATGKQPQDLLAPKDDADRDFGDDFAKLQAQSYVLEPIRARANLLHKLRSEAIAKGLHVMLLLRNGHVVRDGLSTRKKKRAKEYDAAGKVVRKKELPVPNDRQATHAYVEIPGAKWIKLPKVTTPKEDARIEPPKRRKQGKGD